MSTHRRLLKNLVRVSVRVKGYDKTLEPLRFQGFVWRRRRDSNFGRRVKYDKTALWSLVFLMLCEIFIKCDKIR